MRKSSNIIEGIGGLPIAMCDDRRVCVIVSLNDGVQVNTTHRLHHVLPMF
jgi:high-affinity K+ transport system ATPase subunit B